MSTTAPPAPTAHPRGSVTPRQRRLIRRMLAEGVVTVTTRMTCRGLDYAIDDRERWNESAALGLLVTFGLAEWVGDPERDFVLRTDHVVRVTTNAARIAPGREDLARAIAGRG